MVMTRLELITDAKDYAGKPAFKINLNHRYDWILKEITSRYRLIRNQQKTGTLTVDQNYIILPPNFTHPELFKVNEDEVEWVEPEEWRIEYDEDDSSGSPSIWTVQRADNKLFMHVAPSTAWDYILYYGCNHPKAGRSISYTSGGTYEIKAGVTVTGATSGATGTVSFITLTSGTFAGGTAAGKLIFSSQTGTFQSENLNVGSSLNVATIGGNSEIEDNFEHLLSEEFDETIMLGLAWWVCAGANPPLSDKAILYKKMFEESLDLHAPVFNRRRSLTVPYRGF